MSDYLTKSAILAGMQCPKRLWMTKHAPVVSAEIIHTPTQYAGNEVGEYAQKLFPNGCLVDAAPWEHQAAFIQTQKLMKDAAVPAIFEAAFESDEVRVRVDILERLSGDRWRLYEVKSGGKITAEYLYDAAIQTWVARQAGLKLASSHILYLNKDYVRGRNGIDCKKLFSSVDVSEEIKPLIKDISDVIASTFKTIRLKSAPVIQPSKHCGTPFKCEFWDRCVAHKPDDWVRYLPRITQKAMDQLAKAGIEAISDIPKEFPISATQQITRNAVASGKEWVSPKLANILKEIEPPCYYLDFETFKPAIPLFAGHRPQQQLPFQWSLHHIDKKGKLTHTEFLAAPTGDPTLQFTESLIEALDGSKEPIVVYHTFENTILNNMSAMYPALAKPIAKIQKRLHDLKKTIAENYCHPEFMGSYSIKTVGPVLAPDVDYKGLQLIANGGDAMTYFERMVKGEIPNSEIEKYRRALLTYCELDTMAMVKVHGALSKCINQA